MSLYELHGSLFTRLPGILLLWLLAWTVGIAYACSPQMEIGESVSQAMLAAVDDLHAENCDKHSPSITMASLGKVSAGDLRNLTTASLFPGLLSLFLLPVGVGGNLMLPGFSPHSPSPIYLATARMRI
ncbi:hypothetical protein HOP62_07880 [Halomonas sp. MCCC 1A17488]|uniref:Uncharacterized protein n=1 Tax=Billgrantia sulfidoxydans TaxID=2733484 RepID=A0ABX7W1T0_9GAMM|nr:MULTISPECIES: hypothetical protein [Halomonas]MCE8015994.1 hypothetical protein [Halomonas sp. MCCC 1A17488]MCG3239327.1 hypothetical protein [Halomonas sp. MCCC 1A17488]QPP50743.1 hypothetical protein I4484_06505 [Halomonas sp. SS10-MC5]QTP54319.1 hypothetical protein HNO51_06220 [Halomonas sulfidoxydans]